MTVSDYINRFADCSKTPQHELIVECLEYYALYGTRELTLEQAAGWWEIVKGRSTYSVIPQRWQQDQKGEQQMDLKKKKDLQAAERLERLANQSFSKTDIEINVQYEKSIKNGIKDRK